MLLFLGLGNPDKQYQTTRHNIGHQVIACLANRLNLTLETKPKLESRIAQTTKAIFGQTTTYMNQSGLAAQKLLNFYKINPPDLYVIHDDLDIRVGESKIQFGRGSAGHHGIDSLVQYLGTQEFNRIRIGIGHPRNSTNPNLPVEDYVLQQFTSDEKVIINQTIDKITTEIINILGS